jgi:hypothetical protein
MTCDWHNHVPIIFPMARPQKLLLIDLAEEIDSFARLFLEAKPFMLQVHYADHLAYATHSVRKEIEKILKTGKPTQTTEIDAKALRPKLARVRRTSTPADAHLDHPPVAEAGAPDPRQFRDMTLVEASVKLLTEHPRLHGKKIEELLKTGGYPTKAKHFQTMLEATFRRDGRFRNVGGNTWELKEPSLFANGKVEVGQAEQKET